MTFARNISTRYVVLAVNLIIGLVMLRYNVQHLGRETWGLWMLAAQVTAYFAVLDLGYGTAVVKYVAQFRTRRDVRGLNEVLSTMAYVFTGIGVLCYLLAIVAAILLPHIFNLSPGQVETGRIVVLTVGVYVALLFHFSIYGGVINGFERYYINNLTDLSVNVAAALVNFVVLWLGYGLVELVIGTTLARVLPLWIYRRNAYRVFPQLQISRRLFRRDRLRELSGFSVYVAMVDWASRIMFTTDTFFIGVFLNTAAVAFYAVAQRIAENLLMLTAQIHTLLMPAIVSRSDEGDVARQRSLMVRATRFQLAIAVCFCGGVAVLVEPLIEIWLGPGWDGSVLATRLLAVVVVLRALIAMPMTVLQGSGHHRYVAAVSSAGAILNVALSVPLVQTWGVTGVCVSTVISAALCGAALFARTCRAVEMRVARGVREVILPATWPAVVALIPVAAVEQFVSPGPIGVVANLAAAGLLYGVLFVRLGLDANERLWLMEAVRQMRRGVGSSAPDVNDFGTQGLVIKGIKNSSLLLLKRAGVTGRLAQSAWRRNHLLILCYHGVSLVDEHDWDPGLYVSQRHLERRFALLQSLGCTVLPFGEAVERLYRRDLPDRAVALTFDDGYYDFMSRAWPVLKAFGYPATVYLTTARVDRNLPIAPLFISYALWAARDRILDGRGLMGLDDRFALASPGQRNLVLTRIVQAMQTNCTPEHTRDQVAMDIVHRLGLDYDTLRDSRVLTLMRPAEVAQLSREGVDFQMHTHLHRTPDDPMEFVHDVLRNRDRIHTITGVRPEHFCYPSGNYREAYLPALREHGIRSATTCDPGIAGADDDPLLLPRFIDTAPITSVVFESWIAGMAALLPRRTRYGGHPVPAPADAARVRLGTAG